MLLQWPCNFLGAWINLHLPLSATGIFSGVIPVWRWSVWQCSRFDPILCGWATAHFQGLRCCDLPPSPTEPPSACHRWATEWTQRQKQQCWGRKAQWLQQTTQFKHDTHWHTASQQSTAKVRICPLNCRDKVCSQRNITYFSFFFMCGRSGSQPANLENVGRRPSLQSAQSDSNIRTGTLSQTWNIHLCLCMHIQ